jgi:hypothetical protein
MPVVADCSRPIGEPMAITQSPTDIDALEPSVAGLRPLAPCSWMTAMSVSGSEPRTLAANRRPSASLTSSFSAWSTT